MSTADPMEDANIDDGLVGTTLFDKFEILSLIAQGGMGRVYKARDTRLQTIIALKLLKQDDANAKNLMRFQAEAKATSRLKHANIAEVYDFALTDKTAYLSMEFVDGDTLDKLVADLRTLPISLFYQLFLDICKGLQHAHQQGIIHRDLKPSNIIITETNRGAVAKILDFGIAKQIELGENQGGLTTSGSLIGTPQYMSPEQTRGQATSPQSDVYGLGCLMWHALTGEPPFSGDNAFATMQLHQSGSVNIEDLPEDCPPELKSLIVKMLAKNPTERPSLSKQILPILSAPPSDDSNSQSPFSDQSKTGNQLQADSQSPSRIPSQSHKPSQQIKLAPLAIVVALVVAATATTATIVSNNDQERKTIGDARKRADDRKLAEKANSVSPLAEIDDPLTDGKYTKGRIERSQGDVVYKCNFACKDEMLAKLTARDITHMELSDSAITDEAFKHLAKFPQLAWLHIPATSIKTLDGISNIKRLTFLDISNTDITDKSIDNLLPLQNLIGLNVSSCTELGDAGLEKISRLSKLQRLELNNTNFSSLKPLAKLKELRIIRLNSSSAKFDDVKYLASSLPHVVEISVSKRGHITDTELLTLQNQFKKIRFDPDRVLIQKLEEAPKKLSTTLGDFAFSNGEYKVAIERYEEVLEARKEEYGPRSYQVAGACIKLGYCYVGLKQLEQAKEKFETALDILEEIPPQGKYETKTKPNLYIGLANIEINQKNYARAEKLNAKALQLASLEEGPGILMSAQKQRLQLMSLMHAGKTQIENQKKLLFETKAVVDAKRKTDVGANKKTGADTSEKTGADASEKTGAGANE